MTGGHTKDLAHLISTVLGPRRAASPDADRLVAALLGSCATRSPEGSSA